MKETTCLYRHFDSEGALLYVGISLSAIERLRKHRESKRFDKIATVTIERFKTRELALNAERIAIRDEDPKFNVEGRIRRRPDRGGITVPIDNSGFTITWTKGALAEMTEEERKETQQRASM